MIKVLELFGGIGACSKAFKRLGIDTEIADYVEIDKYAVASYNAINGTNFEPQDITKWDKDIDVDFIMHGSPCQDFSVAGLNKGGDEGSGTRSSLMYETIRIVAKLKPKYVLWENVKNLLSKKHKHNFDNYIKTMSELGYNSYYQVLNSKNYGIPQNRERVFTLSIRQDIDNGTFTFPKPIELKLKLKDMLEQEVDEKYYLSDKMIVFFTKNEEIQKEKGNGFRFGVTDGDVIAKSITTRAGSRMDDNFIGNKRADKTINENADDIKENSFIDCYNNKIINNGTTTTITARINDSNHFIAIKNNTKKGYLEAYEGDGVDIENINSKTRRGRVQKDMIQTLNTSDNKAVIIKSAYSRNFGSKGKLQGNICSTLQSAMGEGGGNIPLYKETNKYIEKKYEKFNNEKGYMPEMFNPYNESEIKEIASAQSTSCGSTTSSATILKKEGLRIRKLTPKECWRLMGFDDSDFDKAAKVNSNAQLYKQAGNSIVVNVLEKILENLFLKTENDFEGQISFDMFNFKG